MKVKTFDSLDDLKNDRNGTSFKLRSHWSDTGFRRATVYLDGALYCFDTETAYCNGEIIELDQKPIYTPEKNENHY